MAKCVLIRDIPSGTVSKNCLFVPGSSLETIVTANATQTMTNKTLTAPTITNATISNTTATMNVATLAALGGNIATAAPIVTAVPCFIYVTGANAATGVQLPVAAAGSRITIKNADAANAVLCVYPQVNSTVNGLSANATFNMAANTMCELVALNATAWFSAKTPA
jgi:hypothetical protein